MESILKSKLIGEQLSSVTFVQDYLQLHFDGKTFTIYIWPAVKIDDTLFHFGEQDYRNALCSLIAHKVTDLLLIEEETLVIFFENTNKTIHLNLNPNNSEIVAEIAFFHDDLDSTWLCFQ
ncbi:MAG: hypothetical protein R2792_08980 [Saprospiraceae bacterium]